MALEEPSVSELIRDLFALNETIARDVRDLRDQQAAYVTKETHDRDIADLKREVAELKNKRQQWWTLLTLPVMVSVLVILFQKWVT